MKRCDIHNLPLAHIEGTVNGDPLVCAKCAYETALSLSKQLEETTKRAARKEDQLNRAMTLLDERQVIVEGWERKYDLLLALFNDKAA